MNKAAMNINFHRANKDLVEALEAFNIARGLMQAANLTGNSQALEDAHGHLENASRKLYNAASLSGSIKRAVSDYMDAG